MRLILNPASGPGSGNGDDVIAALREVIPDLEVVELDGVTSVTDAAGRAPLPAALCVCGGDGTVGAVAAAAAALALPLLVVPGGTRNHFAHDLGINSVVDAAAAADAWAAVAVDVGNIDGHLFVNNASLGFYPDLVRVRERWENRLGKRLATLVALVAVLVRSRPLCVEIDGRERRIWCAFFGNGRYDEGGLFTPIGRSSLTDDVVDVRIVRAAGKWSRLRLLAAFFARRLERASVYEISARRHVEIRAAHPLRVAADGETIEAGAAFAVCVRAQALHVFVPPSLHKHGGTIER